MVPRDITRLNRDIRVIGDIRERIPYRKTPIDITDALSTMLRLLGEESEEAS